MANFNTVINSFIAGEVSPKISGRSETAQFNQSCEELTNMFVRPEGGAFRRGGSRLLFSEPVGTYDYSGGIVLIPMQTAWANSPSQDYSAVIMLKGSHISHWKMGTISGATTILDPQPIRLMRLDTLSSISLTLSDYRKTQYAQNGNTLIITNPKFPPLKLVYNSSDFTYTLMHYWDELYNASKTFTVTIANPAVFTIVAHGKVNGEKVYFKTTGALPSGILTNVEYYIKSVAANTFEISATNGGASIASGGAQSGTHTAYFLTHNAAIDNTSIYQAWKRKAYKNPNIANSFGRGTVTSSSAAVSSAQTLTFSEPVASADMVGTYIKISDPGAATKSGVFYVQSYVSNTSVLGSVVSTLPGVAAYGGSAIPASSWEEEAFGGYSNAPGTDKYPSACSFYQQRLVLAGNVDQQNTLYFSRAGNIFEFMQIPLQQDTDYSKYQTPDIAANNYPFSLNIASEEPSKILWITQNKLLTVGTTLREYACITEGVIGLFTPPSFIAQTSYGSTHIKPTRKDGYAVFVDSQYRVRDLQFNFNEDAWKSEDLSILADHMRFKAYNQITSSQPETDPSSPTNDVSIESLAMAAPHDYIFAADLFGGLSCITVKKEAGVTAYSNITLGGVGYNSIGAVCPKVTSVLFLGNCLYLCVLRYDTGRAVEYATIESINLAPQILHADRSSSYTAMAFLDGYMQSAYSMMGKSVWSSSTDFELTNLDRYNGESVRVFADGFDLGNFTVTAGTITLPYAVGRVTIGYPYTSKIVTNYLNPGSPIGSPQGILKKIDTIVVRFFRTIFAEVGNKLKVDPIPFRSPTTPGNTVTPAFTGDKIIMPYANIESDGKVVVQTSAPYPMNVTSIAVRGSLYD